MKSFSIGTAIFILAFPIHSFAEIGSRNAVIDKVQLESANRVGYEDIVYIQQTGAWSATTCRTDWAYFNAKDNPHFVATVLSSRVSNMKLTVSVDDLKPKVGDICQIINLVY